MPEQPASPLPPAIAALIVKLAKTASGKES